jgi:hypothetical protein
MAGAQIVRKFGSCDILDYGCGKETLRRAMGDHFPPIKNMCLHSYDPCRPGYDSDPDPADIVVCTDVMEHVEQQCVESVLRHVCDLTQRVAIIDVALAPAVKTLPDGRNAHISLHNKDWWLSYFKKYFVLIEQHGTDASLLVVGQPIKRWQERMRLKAAA